MKEASYSITLLGDAYHINIEKHGDYAQIIDEFKNISYRNKRNKPALLLINI